jgi:hypothetical protein
MEVLCYYCKKNDDKVMKDQAVRIDNKNFHPHCAKIYADKKELSETICRIFKLKAPGPRNNAFISKYINEGMTYKGITRALMYFYDVQKNNTDKSNGGIGIVPWVYEDANRYYEKKENMEKELEAAIEYSKNNQPQEEPTRKVRVQKIEKTKTNIQTFDENDFEW